MFFLIAALLDLGGLALLIDNHRMEVLPTSSALMLASAGFALAGFLRMGFRDHWLGICFCSYFGVVFPLGGIVFPLFPESMSSLLPVDAAALSLALLVAGTGWLCFVLGYLIYNGLLGARTRTRLQAFYRSHPCSYSWPLLLALGVAGLPFRFFVQAFAHSAIGTALAYLGDIPPTLANLGLICTCALGLAPRRAYRFAGMGVLSIYVVIGLLSGQRGTAFVPALTFASFYLLTAAPRVRLSPSRRVSVKAVVLIAALIASVVVSFPVLTRMKMLLMEKRGSVSGTARIGAVADTLQQAYTNYRDQPIEEKSVSANLLRFHRRLSQLQYAAFLATKGRQEWGMLYGASLLDSVIVFVPRILWPDKPGIGLGPRSYQLMVHDERAVGANTIPVSVDWYLNYDLIGVVLGMLLIGAFYAMVDARSSGTNPLGCAFLAFLTYDLMVAGHGISGIIATVLLHGLPVLLILWLVRRRSAYPSPAVSYGRRPYLRNMFGGRQFSRFGAAGRAHLLRHGQ